VRDTTGEEDDGFIWSGWLAGCRSLRPDPAPSHDTSELYCTWTLSRPNRQAYPLLLINAGRIHSTGRRRDQSSGWSVRVSVRLSTPAAFALLCLPGWLDQSFITGPFSLQESFVVGT
jgi:hypothetical protein